MSVGQKAAVGTILRHLKGIAAALETVAPPEVCQRARSLALAIESWLVEME